MKKFIEAVGGRKTLMSLLVIAVGLAVDLATDRGLSTNLLTLLISVAGGYITGNVVTKFALGKNKIESKTNPKAYLKDAQLADQYNEISKSLSSISGRLVKAAKPLKQADDKKLDAIIGALTNIQQGSAQTLQILQAAIAQQPPPRETK